MKNIQIELPHYGTQFRKPYFSGIFRRLGGPNQQSRVSVLGQITFNDIILSGKKRTTFGKASRWCVLDVFQGLGQVSQ